MSTLDKEMFQPNSHKSKEVAEVEDKKVEKVISGSVVTKKKSWISKVKDSFISEDAGSIGDYIVHDIVIPAVKDNLLDVVSRGVEMLLFGGTPQTRSRGSKTGSRIYTSYDTYYRPERRRDADRRSESYSRASRRDISDIVLDSRGEAETVLDHMADLCETYRQVTVADLYELVGITSSYTDNGYGWTDLRDAGVRRTRDGYILSLPRPRQLD